jgi:hypothetical protein
MMLPLPRQCCFTLDPKPGEGHPRAVEDRPGDLLDAPSRRLSLPNGLASPRTSASQPMEAAMISVMDDRFALPAVLTVVAHARLHHPGFRQRRHA